MASASCHTRCRDPVRRISSASGTRSMSSSRSGWMPPSCAPVRASGRSRRTVDGAAQRGVAAVEQDADLDGSQSVPGPGRQAPPRREAPRSGPSPFPDVRLRAPERRAKVRKLPAREASSSPRRAAARSASARRCQLLDRDDVVVGDERLDRHDVVRGLTERQRSPRGSVGQRGSLRGPEPANDRAGGASAAAKPLGSRRPLPMAMARRTALRKGLEPWPIGRPREAWGAERSGQVEQAEVALRVGSGPGRESGACTRTRRGSPARPTQGCRGRVVPAG